MPRLTIDILQNELILIDHHLGDIEKALEQGDAGYGKKGIKDAKEAIQRLTACLPKKASKELARMEESKNKKPTALHMTSKQRRKAGKLNESFGQPGQPHDPYRFVSPEPKGLPLPEWASFYAVDEIIECFTFGHMRQAVESELLAACPDAYSDLPPATDDPEVPFEYPEQKRSAIEGAGRTLDRHWDKLSPEVQKIIIWAYNKEHARDNSGFAG